MKTREYDFTKQRKFERIAAFALAVGIMIFLASLVTS